jgi:peptidoglycan hydrolase-like protein with peptidoglycan-binding domain
MDLLVLQSQQWLNATYKGRSGYAVISEDGATGWQTMYALTRALQIELGIATPSDNFGPTTMSTLTSKYGTIGAGFTENKNVVTIIQCALWCKGYAGGAIVPFGESNPAKSIGSFTSEVGSAVASIRSDMGLASSPTVPPKVFKSLLNMDAYVTVNNGKSSVRTVQQFLNGKYWERDFRIMPCDGHYSRDVQQGLMYAIQFGLGMADGDANGNFGPGTQSGIKSKANLSVGSSDDERRFVSLFQAALIFNGYDCDFTGKYTSTTQTAAKAFQSFCELPTHGSADFATWASLLVSTGDPDRQVTACDTSTPLTSDTAVQLMASGYRAVGRYLNGSSKGLRVAELSIAANAGLSIFPIYQEWNNLEELREYGAETFGYRQGRAAALRARQVGFPAGTTIYFPIDADATADEIDALVLDYYRGVRSGIELSSTVANKVGCYGPRNVGIKVTEAGLADTTFVVGLSTGWSANLGFPLPKNWAYDQIKETSTGSGSHYIEIDRNASSSRAKPVSMGAMQPVPTVGSDFDKLIHWPFEEYCFQAEVFQREEVKSLSNDDLTQIVLNQLQRSPDSQGNPREWNANFIVFSPFSPALEPHRVLFENRLPRVGSRPMRGEDPDEVDARANALRGMLDTPAYDMPHFAASLRGYLQWGIYGGSPETQVGDLGAWALDLVQAWTQYESDRTGNGGRTAPYAGGVTEWFARIGTEGADGDASGFGYADLVGDIDAYLAAMQLIDAGGTLSSIMREIWQQASRDPLYRRRAFARVRFNLDENTAKRAVRHLFTITPSFWINAPVEMFVSSRRPGEPKAGVALPPQAELSRELDEVASAFTSMLFRDL